MTIKEYFRLLFTGASFDFAWRETSKMFHPLWLTVLLWFLGGVIGFCIVSLLRRQI